MSTKAFGTGLVFAAALLGAGVACSSKGGGGSTVDFVGEYCALVAPCCASAGLETTGDQCDLIVTAAMEQATVTASASVQQACLSAAQAEATFCTTLGGDIPSCEQVFGQGNGAAQPGGACVQDADCAVASGGGAACLQGVVPSDGGSAGVCVQTTEGQVGQGPCVGTVQGQTTTYFWSEANGAEPPAHAYVCNVADGTTCDTSTQQCAALATAGQPCSTDTDCVVADYCATTTTATACAPRLADGASCAAAPTGCKTTSTCDPVTSLCSPLAATGATCNAGTDCQSGECVSNACASGLGNSVLPLYCD